MIGGSLLVKLLEIIINCKERKFPKTSIKKGMFNAIVNIYKIYKFTQLTSVSLNNNNNQESLLYYSRLYTIHKTENISRLSVAYYTIFNDALTAFKKTNL